MGVLAIWRYPVKAMLGELLETVDVTRGGLEGDRRWVVSDAASGEQIASKRGPTDVRLRACRAQIDADGRLVVTLPDAGITIGAAAVADALSDLLERHVVLAEHAGGGDRYMRTGGHHDFAPVHLLTTSALARMQAVAPASDWDVRRFRPNVVIDDDGAALGTSIDSTLLGAGLRGPSGVSVTVGLPTPRCVVTTRAQEELPADAALLRAIAGTNRWDLGPLGRPACLGVYAEVERVGRLAIGDRLQLLPRGEAAAAAAVARCVERVVAPG